MRLPAGFRPDPLGELQRSLRPLAAIGGGVLLLRRRGEEGREERERKGEVIGKGKERENKGEGERNRKGKKG